jgi:hypothetical protein
MWYALSYVTFYISFTVKKICAVNEVQGVKLDYLPPGGYKYGVLALQIGEVSNLGQ